MPLEPLYKVFKIYVKSVVELFLGVSVYSSIYEGTDLEFSDVARYTFGLSIMHTDTDITKNDEISNYLVFHQY